VLVGVLITLVSLIFIFSSIVQKKGQVWVCKNNKWVAKGTPSYPKPDDPCGKKYPLPKTSEDCLKEGGVWKKMGPDPIETCNIKTMDRGTICTDNSECEGWCQANLTRDQLQEGMQGKSLANRKGQCSVWRVELGCFGMLRQGTVSVICVD